MHPRNKIDSYYMIGDTPLTDIKGANANGIYSILVKTGMFKGINSPINPARKVTENVYEAIRYIIHKERL